MRRVVSTSEIQGLPRIEKKALILHNKEAKKISPFFISASSVNLLDAESTITPLGIAELAALKSLSTNNDNPSIASRPFDVDRNGFVMAEGAGTLIVEEYEHAINRGAKIYAEIIGFEESGDAYHMTTPSMDEPLRSMQKALKMEQ